MASSAPTCALCAGPCDGRGLATFKDGLLANNPISVQLLGVCSALAVTSKLSNSLVMGAALIFVSAGTNLMVSLLRKVTPRRIRMIAEVAIIATFVILVDQLLKAFYWEMSKRLGAYVGLIITNCIVMGRAEAFAMRNRPLVSVLDGVANGLGYAAVLGIIGFARELMGNGTILGYPLLVAADDGGWYVRNLLMVGAPGAFLALGFLIAIVNAIRPPAEEVRP